MQGRMRVGVSASGSARSPHNSRRLGAWPAWPAPRAIMPPERLVDAAGWRARFWRWSRGGYAQGRACPTSNHRGWLWSLGRLSGMLPISFKECVCAAPFAAPRPEHPAAGDASLPTWDQTARVTTSRCSCPVAERSIPWLVYSFAVVLVLVPNALYGLYSDAKNANTEGKPSLRMQGKTDMMVTFCDIISVSLCSVTCFAQLAFSQTALFMVLEQLQQVDRTLSSRAPAVPGMLALWLVFLAGVIFMDGLMWTEISNTISYAATYFPFYVVYFLTFVMEVLFIDDAHGIYMRFLALNEKLDQSLALPTYQAATEQLPFGAVDGGWLGEASRTTAGTAVSITGIAESNGMYSSKTDNKRATRLRPGAAGLAGLATGPIAGQPLTIQRLNVAHHVLCEASTAVAKRYGLCLLVDVLCILLHLVITAYFFLKQLMNSHLINTTQYVVVQFLWLGVHLMRLLLIVLPCSRASAEATRTGALVGVVLSTASPYTVAHKQLESFSIQLLHHKVNFNACGLFELGLPLVVSILGAVTTYLVVLLQLKGNPTGPALANSTAAVLETS